MAVAPYETPRMSEARLAYLELRSREQSDEERRRRLDDGDRRLDDLIAEFERFVADRDRELDELVSAGELTTAGAEKIRAWRLTPPEPAPLALPAPSETPQARRGSSPPREGPPPPSYTPEREAPNGQISPLPGIDAGPTPWLDEPAPPDISEMIEINIPTRGDGVVTRYVQRK